MIYLLKCLLINLIHWIYLIHLIHLILLMHLIQLICLVHLIHLIQLIPLTSPAMDITRPSNVLDTDGRTHGLTHGLTIAIPRGAFAPKKEEDQPC